MDVLSGRLGNVTLGTDQLPTGPDADQFFGTRRRAAGSGLSRAKDGVAVIPIIGSLVNRGAWIGANSGAVSYEGIAAQLDDAARDPEVKTIILDIDSPGGEAAGMAGIAALIRAVNAAKPVIASVNDMAASAAYGIASQCSRIVISPTSTVGSIGVVMMHADRSGELAKKGIAVTLIYAGESKVDGHPFGPLPENVKADLQAEVAEHYALFTALVGQGRGKRLDQAAAAATEARCFLGRTAIAAGLADEIGSFSEIVADLATPTARRARVQQKGAKMALSEDALAERERIKSILTCDAAKGREKQATMIALETDMTADQATAILEVAPVEQSKPRIPTIEERAAEQEQIGHGGFSGASDTSAVFAAAGLKRREGR